MIIRNNHTNSKKNNRSLINRSEAPKYFYFDLSKKNEQVVLPIEEETVWEQLHEITWDPARGD